MHDCRQAGFFSPKFTDTATQNAILNLEGDRESGLWTLVSCRSGVKTVGAGNFFACAARNSNGQGSGLQAPGPRGVDNEHAQDGAGNTFDGTRDN